MTTTRVTDVVRESLGSPNATLKVSMVVREALIGGSASTKADVTFIVRESLQSFFALRRSVPFKIGW